MFRLAQRKLLQILRIENSAGGILDATYPGQLPHNEQQISNFKSRTPVSTGQKLSYQTKSNELYSIMLQVHLEEGSEKFIQDVKAYPEPAIVLASEQQLLDLERFCCYTTLFLQLIPLFHWVILMSHKPLIVICDRI